MFDKEYLKDTILFKIDTVLRELMNTNNIEEVGFISEIIKNLTISYRCLDDCDFDYEYETYKNN